MKKMVLTFFNGVRLTDLTILVTIAHMSNMRVCPYTIKGMVNFPWGCVYLELLDKNLTSHEIKVLRFRSREI